MSDTEMQIYEHLRRLYGDEQAARAWSRLRGQMERFRQEVTPRAKPGTTPGLTQQDAILITYGDQVREAGYRPLRTLAGFAQSHLKGLVSGVHILPFYPYSSDDGFSVIDYWQVDPDLGSWDDIARLGGDFRLMFDAVINHISAGSAWFQAFLDDQAPYRDYFITVDPGSDLSQVVRPRALPLLTPFETPSGEKAVWTTFSADQIDLNYHNPDALLEISDLLLFYAARGAEFIRLDAIAYLWKEIGTPCIHLPQTHRLVQLLRAVLDATAPQVMLITETNVPHEDNVSYFGDGSNEAQLVYNFALPPLVLHTLHTGSAEVLSKWAAGLKTPSQQTTFFNFLASHDGIGLNPARGILPEAEIEGLVERTQRHGGLVSYKQNSDGTQSPYELNVNYFDALSNPDSDEPIDVQVKRFIVAHAIMYSLVGVPGIYFHSLFGSRGWPEGVRKTGHNRTINRQKLWRDELEKELATPDSLPERVFRSQAALLRVRASSPAFHPQGAQDVVECNQAIFALLRVSPDHRQRILCLHNVSAAAQAAHVDFRGMFPCPPVRLKDLITGEDVEATESLVLRPYQVLWLTERS